MNPRVLVIGDGKMGRAVAQVARDRECEVVGVFGPAEMSRGLAANIADVAIEFTEPTAAPGNVRACFAAQLPVVSGTTGWDAELPVVRAEAEQGGRAFLHAPNFSIGVAVFARVVRAMAEMTKGLPAGFFSSYLVETHHSAKLDAPSGTAKMLAKVAHDASGTELPIMSVRMGHIPGVHEVIFDAPFEQIRLTHLARDRRVFAEGAVAAARWLVGKRGVFTFADYINERLNQ